MDLAHWLWLATAVYGVHALEEMVLDWRDWARAVVGLPVEWSHFYVVNFLVVVLGVASANLAFQAPGLALGFAGLMVINALFFHVAPFLRSRGRRYSPGLFTAVVLLLPVAAGCYRAAAREDLLSAGTIAASFLVGALLMATPVVLLNLKDKPYFRQDR